MCPGSSSFPNRPKEGPSFCVVLFEQHVFFCLHYICIQLEISVKTPDMHDNEKKCNQKMYEKLIEFLIAPMGVLAPRLRTLDVSTCPPIDTSGNFPARVSAESPLNISPKLSEVISEVSEP